ncbi:MAG: hypothetical protein RL172_347 [Bacteroidota bacterium]|jgi:mono/diheme cytochrome c family protein
MLPSIIAHRPSLKKSISVLLLAGVVYITSASFKNSSPASSRADSTLSKKAFLKVYDVLISPRCVNCHPAGDIPLQGENGQLHSQNVKRGKDGKGMYAAKCINCHMDKTQPGLNMPPGTPNWHLPPADMKMVFQGKTPRELAAQLLNPATNAGKSTAQLIAHVVADPLVLYGWNPGEGRQPPPISHEEFVTQFKLWIDNGAYFPEN